METIKALTSYQQELINGLVNEFTKINPTPTNGIKRFGMGMINECINEEQRFRDTIAKHNLSMIKLFVCQLENDVKSFKEEFGEVIDISFGYTYPRTLNQSGTLDKFVERNTAYCLNANGSHEIQLMLVSEVK